MKDLGLVCMAGFIAVCYFIYMYIGPGGDGVIFGSVLGAICVLAGVKYERNKTAIAYQATEDPGLSS